MLGTPSPRSSRLLPGPLVLRRAAHRLVRPGIFLACFGRLGFSVRFGHCFCGFQLLVPASSGVLRFPLFRGWFAPVAIGKIGLQWSGLTLRSTGRATAGAAAFPRWRSAPVNSNVRAHEALQLCTILRRVTGASDRAFAVASRSASTGHARANVASRGHARARLWGLVVRQSGT